MDCRKLTNRAGDVLWQILLEIMSLTMTHMQIRLDYWDKVYHEVGRWMRSSPVFAVAVHVALFSLPLPSEHGDGVRATARFHVQQVRAL